MRGMLRWLPLHKVVYDRPSLVPTPVPFSVKQGPGNKAITDPLQLSILLSIGLILAFNVSHTKAVGSLAKRSGVQILEHNVIYKLLEQLKVSSDLIAPNVVINRFPCCRKHWSHGSLPCGKRK